MVTVFELTVGGRCMVAMSNLYSLSFIIKTCAFGIFCLTKSNATLVSYQVALEML